MDAFDDFSSLAALAALRLRATLFHAPDGGPIRNLAAHPSARPMGLYQSAKAGRSLSWNQYVQQSRYLYCEASPYVAKYMAQPHRLEINLPSGVERFFPDLRVEMRSGRVVIERLIPPKGVNIRERRNIEFARDIYTGRGFEFRVLYASEVLGTVAEKNAREISFDRFTVVTAGDLARARDAFEALGGEAPYARAIEALGGPGLGRARLHALIMRGHLLIDLEKPIRISSRVWLPPSVGGQS
jgi:hypothetical protein